MRDASNATGGDGVTQGPAGRRHDGPGPRNEPGPHNEPTRHDGPGPRDEPGPHNEPTRHDEPEPRDEPGPHNEPTRHDEPGPHDEPRPRDAAAGGPGWHAVAWGLLGVLAFSFSLPMTRLAVEDLDPTFIGLGRALVAAVLAGALLAIRRAPLPARRDLPRFVVVALGVVVGFPLFSTLALQNLTSAHASVIVGLLPAATAVFAVLRANERPTKAFWLAAAAGLVAVLVFAATQGVSGLATADLLVLAAVLAAGLGYAEGGALARTYGGPQVICWALLISAPFLILPTALAAGDLSTAGADAWLGFAYVSVISMFLGFFAWYRGLALGGVAKIGQTQLAQPVLTLLWSALLLAEQVTLGMVVAALAVLACVVATQRTRASAHEERGRGRALDPDRHVTQRT